MVVRPAPAGARAETWTHPNLKLVGAVAAPQLAPDNLFERTAWLYAYFREHVFRDETTRIETAFWPLGSPRNGSLLLEIGCGPGVYARQLAARHAGLRTIGIDQSPALLRRAEQLADRDRILNCWFEEGDALALDWPDASVDAIVASRLFTVVDGAGALAEMYRVLRPGGRCLIAEPATLLDTLVPMATLRLAGWLTASAATQRGGSASVPWPLPLPSDAFAGLISSQPWASQNLTHERGYHYAVCQKPLERDA